MARIRNDYTCAFKRSDRLNRVMAYNQKLAYEGKHNLYTADLRQLVYHWTDKANAIVPQTGEWSSPVETNYSLGDHGCRVDIGMGFPLYDQVPSHVNGYEETPENFALDYAFLLDNSPAEIHPDESIIGEFHWEMNEVRKYDFGPEIHKLGDEVRMLGAGGTSHGHTCLDFSIGLEAGWGGILAKIEKYLALYTRLDHKQKAGYLRGQKIICQAIMRYMQKHADRAAELAAVETNPEQKALYELQAKDCGHIAYYPPETYHQAIQWMQFAIMTDRLLGHGNGYGSLDAYLNPFLEKDLKSGLITRQDAREYLAEMFLKIRGQHFSICGRKKDGSDATNEMSFVVLETYDMIDDYNNLFVMWHPDINQDLFKYACDIVARHGASIPSFSNYDLMLDCELRSGVDPEVAWTVCSAGCQWFCIPGREYCDQDVNALVLLDPMWRTMDRAIEENTQTYERFFDIFTEEFKRTAEALRIFKDAQYNVLDKVWPEMVPSLHCHGPIERGIDMTGHRGVDVQYTSTNLLGLPNVTDSFYAIKRLVFEEKMYTMAEVRKAVSENWKDQEIMRQRFLNQPKFGNDIDDVDQIFVDISDMIADVMDNTYNCRGQQYRASLFHFQGHTAVDILPATPDGRLASEPLAHGCNPTAGRNTNGLLATANSLAKVHNYKFQGGSLQVELQPKFFDGKEKLGDYIEKFVVSYLSRGTFQVNLNVIDLEALKDAIDHPEKPDYQNIIVRVTGYTSRFICLAKPFQEEFVGRNNYKAL